MVSKGKIKVTPNKFLHVSRQLWLDIKQINPQTGTYAAWYLLQKTRIDIKKLGRNLRRIKWYNLGGKPWTNLINAITLIEKCFGWNKVFLNINKILLTNRLF